MTTPPHPIAELIPHLSARTYNALTARWGRGDSINGYETVEQVAAASDVELCDLRNIGPLALAEIRRAVTTVTQSPPAPPAPPLPAGGPYGDGPPTGALVEPFAAGDPLSYPELSDQHRALRALMAVLADTGAVVAWPPELAPRYLDVEIAAGWTLRPSFVATPDTKMLLMRVVRTGLFGEPLGTSVGPHPFSVATPADQARLAQALIGPAHPLAFTAVQPGDRHPDPCGYPDVQPCIGGHDDIPAPVPGPADYPQTGPRGDGTDGVWE